MLSKRVDVEGQDNMTVLTPELLKRLSEDPSRKRKHADEGRSLPSRCEFAKAVKEKLSAVSGQQRSGIDNIENLYLRVSTLRLRNAQRTYETVLMVTNVAVIILTVLLNEMVISSQYASTRDNLSIIMLFLSCVSWVVLFLKYHVATIIYNKKFGYNASFVGYLWATKKLVTFLFELLINAVHPFPFIEAGIEWITLFVFLRVYPLVWLVSRFSLIMKRKDLIRQAFMTMGGSRIPRFGAGLGLKELMHRHSIPTLTILMLVVIPSISYVMFFTDQRVPEPNFQNYGQTIYWTLITVASVGYGDFYPTKDNDPGLVIACFAAVIGAVIVSAVSGIIVSALEISESEQMAEAVTLRQLSIKDLRRDCVDLVKMAVQMSAALPFDEKVRQKMESMKQRFFIRLSEKKEKQLRLMADLSYSDHFVVSDAITELLEFEKEQSEELNECIRHVMRIRTVLAVVRNAFGGLPENKASS